MNVAEFPNKRMHLVDRCSCFMSLLVVSLGLLGGVAAGQELPGTPQDKLQVQRDARQEVIDYLVALNNKFWTRVKDFKCLTGEDVVEGKEALDHFLGSDDARIDAWFQLALQSPFVDERTNKKLGTAVRWANTAFQIGSSSLTIRGQKGLLRFEAAVKKREGLLLEAARREVREKGRLQHGRLFVALRTWHAIPLVLEVAANNARKGYVDWEGEVLSQLALRDPNAYQDIQPQKLEGEALKTWLKDWQTWWEKHRPLTPAQTLLKTAQTWKIPFFPEGPRLMAITLLEGQKSLDMKDLLALLESPWPRTRETNEREDAAPQESRIALPWTYLRDAAFVVAYQRDPAGAIRAMETGLAKNQRIYGQWILGQEGDPQRWKPTLFKDWLPERLKADIDTRIRAEKLDPVLRTKWLVIRDQFFPPDEEQWKTLTCVYAPYWSREQGQPIWGLEQHRKGTTAHKTYTVPELKELLKSRGY